VQALAQLVGAVLALRAPAPRDDDAGRGDARDAGQPEDLPGHAHRLRRLRVVDEAAVSFEDAIAAAATGDIWLFRGRSLADRAIQTVTNSPVNHVGMVVAIDDLPPLLWHAELGRSLPDVWTGERQRGVQLHRLDDAVATWSGKYGQRAWTRPLQGTLGREHEDRLMQVIEHFDGRPFPTSLGLARRWLNGRVRRNSSLETVYCAELVATTYQRMGLLPSHRPASWYDPGRFWSGDRVELVAPFSLAGEVAVRVAQPAAAPPPAAAGASTSPSETAKTTWWRWTAMKSWLARRRSPPSSS
jgi:hypothetical protein